MSKIHSNLESEMFCASSSYRASLEAVRNRISFLGKRDRLLITMYLDNKNTCGQISRLTGVSESTVARRISRILKRLKNQYFSCALLHRDFLTKTQIGILQDYFIRGLSIRRLAEKYSLTYHSVRKTLRFLRGLRNNKKTIFTGYQIKEHKKCRQSAFTS